MINMFEPRLDSVTFEKKVCTTRCGHPVDDDDLRQEPSYSYIVGKHDDKKQEEVYFNSAVEFKFICEDNLMEDSQVQRRGPEVRLEDSDMHGGTNDSYAAVQQPCTTRKSPISLPKIPKQQKMPSTQALRLLRQQFSPPTHCEDYVKKNFCTAPMGDEH